mmetsp:Transcript_28601/g.68323  ORF Transcript_28601/g.68323 Transcript_28601/m.68323 type:complete len:262 (-) Transcript_28601:4152-4937(-)
MLGPGADLRAPPHLVQLQRLGEEDDGRPQRLRRQARQHLLHRVHDRDGGRVAVRAQVQADLLQQHADQGHPQGQGLQVERELDVHLLQAGPRQVRHGAPRRGHCRAHEAPRLRHGGVHAGREGVPAGRAAQGQELRGVLQAVPGVRRAREGGRQGARARAPQGGRPLGDCRRRLRGPVPAGVVRELDRDNARRLARQPRVRPACPALPRPPRQEAQGPQAQALPGQGAHLGVRQLPHREPGLRLPDQGDADAEALGVWLEA